MKIVAALNDPADAARAQEQGADLIEIRFDLMDGDPPELAETVTSRCTLPVIATFRSLQEGGRYAGAPEEWFERVRSVLPFVDFVDVERRFSPYSGPIRQEGKVVIASCHSDRMPNLYELFDLERTMRQYGDIVKIIVTPQDRGELIDLITFTNAVTGPLCTGVMGDDLRSARAILPVFGSDLAYCRVGQPTSAGQYSVEEFVRLRDLLGIE